MVRPAAIAELLSRAGAAGAYVRAIALTANAVRRRGARAAPARTALTESL
jgi:hypothetical protein